MKQLYAPAVGMMASLLESDVQLVPTWAENGLLAVLLTSLQNHLDTADAAVNILSALNQIYLHNAGEAEVLKYSTPVPRGVCGEVHCEEPEKAIFVYVLRIL